MEITLKVDKKNENKKFDNDIFPEGVHKVKIMNVEKTFSKSGNEMLVIDIKCLLTGSINKFYYLLGGNSGNKSSWPLRNLVEEAKVYTKNSDENYVFDPHDLVGKELFAKIYNEQNKYIDKDLQEKTVLRSRIKKFYGEHNE